MSAPEKLCMIARAISKRDTQAMIKALRAAGLTVDRDSCGAYRCVQTLHATRDGKRTGKTTTRTLFAALPGRRNYLVRMAHNLFDGGDS